MWRSWCVDRSRICELANWAPRSASTDSNWAVVPDSDKDAVDGDTGVRAIHSQSPGHFCQ